MNRKAALMSIIKARPFVKYDPQTVQNSPIKRTTKRRVPRRFALDIGKAIALELMAQKYNFELRIDGDGGAE